MHVCQLTRPEEAQVPLSDHEQQLLSQMEQQLLADDPKFASTMEGSARHPRAGSRMLLGGLGLVVGLGLLFLALVSQQIWLAAPAFLLMLAGVTYGLSRPTARGPVGVVREDGTTQRPGAARGGRSGKGFMDRLEERWDRRNGNGGSWR